MSEIKEDLEVAAKKRSDGPERSDGPSRRRFLTVTGAGLVAGAGLIGGSIAAVEELGGHGGKKAAAASATQSANATARTLGTPASARDFGIMFPSLRSQPFAEPSDTIRQALSEVGKKGGIMDARDDLTAGAKRLLLDPTVNGEPTSSNPYGTNPFNPTMTQGSTFLGQLIDHDITFDRSSQLGSPQNPLLSPNSRTPGLDLDVLFGGGPGSSPSLYVANTDGTSGPKLKIGSGGVYETTAYVANSDGTHTILAADPRNNETLMLEGLVLAFMQAYNRVLDELDSIDLTHFPIARGADLSSTHERYLVAQEVLLWHYHWLIVNEHLPQIVGQSLVDDILKHGNRYYNPPAGNAYMPIEFGGAAYRFGHSQVDSSYRANFSSGTGASSDPNKTPFWGMTFDASIPMPKFDDASTFDRDDMLGGFPGRRRYIGWQTYFDFGDGQVMHNKKIDTTISSTLFTLPVPAIAPGAQTSPTSLPQRNLLRQLTWAFPAGQTVAKFIGAEPLSKADLELIGSVYAPFATGTPLWYYVLAEAKAVTGGLSLGPVGGRIVAETLLGLVRSDSRSYLNAHPTFKPFLGSDLKFGSHRKPAITGSREYATANLLYYSGAVQPGIYR